MLSKKRAAVTRRSLRAIVCKPYFRTTDVTGVKSQAGGHRDGDAAYVELTIELITPVAMERPALRGS